MPQPYCGVSSLCVSEVLVAFRRTSELPLDSKKLGDCSTEAHTTNCKPVSLHGFFLVCFDFRWHSVFECPQYNFFSVYKHTHENYCALRIFKSSFAFFNASHSLTTIFRTAVQSSSWYCTTKLPRLLPVTWTLLCQISFLSSDSCAKLTGKHGTTIT